MLAEHTFIQLFFNVALELHNTASIMEAQQRAFKRMRSLFTMTKNLANLFFSLFRRKKKPQNFFFDNKHAHRLNTKKNWWSQTGSNRRPPECKSGALPAELWPLKETKDRYPETFPSIKIKRNGGPGTT